MLGGDTALAEQLDTNLHKASASAGNKVKRFYRPWWSLSITKARAAVNILIRQISGFQTNTDVRPVLLDRISALSLNLQLPMTIQDCKTELVARRGALTEMEQDSLAVRHAEPEVNSNLA